MTSVPATPDRGTGGPTAPGQTRIAVDPVRNTIAVTVPGSVFDAVAKPGASAIGTLEIGVQGRLVGLEIGDHYVDIGGTPEGTAHLNRSVAVSLVPCQLQDGRHAVEFRRRSDDYEISFPSGNRCWEVGSSDSGETVHICSILVG